MHVSLVTPLATHYNLWEVRNQFLFEKWQIVRLPVSARQELPT